MKRDTRYCVRCGYKTRAPLTHPNHDSAATCARLLRAETRVLRRRLSIANGIVDTFRAAGLGVG